LAAALKASPHVNTTFVVLAAPESVQEAVKAGVGNRTFLRIGGKSPDTTSKPIEAEVTVVSLHAGHDRATQPRHGSTTNPSMRLAAVVRADAGLTALLTTRRTGPSSLQQLISCGINPKDFEAIVIKGVHAPVAAYKDDCATLIRVNTPGITTADMESLTYHNR